MKKIILIALLMPSNQGQARELSHWMPSVLKVDNPNQLLVFAHAGKDCLVTTDELNEIASGVLIRSRIKPLVGDGLQKNTLYLDALVGCTKPSKAEGGIQIYTVTIFFGKITKYAPIFYNYPYGQSGAGRKDVIFSAYKKVLEEAITDYIAVNFDL